MPEQANTLAIDHATPTIGMIPAPSATRSADIPRNACNPRDLIREALDLLRVPLGRFVEARMHREYGERWPEYALGALHSSHGLDRTRHEHLSTDLSALLTLVGRFWNIAFRRDTARFARTYLEEAREFRNGLAHGESFTLADALRAVDTVHRLLPIVGQSDRSRSGRLRADLLKQLAWRGEATRPV